MRRRDVITLVGAAVVSPFAAQAQQASMPVIGFLAATTSLADADNLRAFHRALKETGFTDGENVAVVHRWAENQLDRLPALVSGWLLAFTLSWDDLVISQFVAGPGSSTLPMVIFSKVRLGVSPDVNALATIMVLIVASGIVVSSIWMRYQNKRRERDMRLAQFSNL